MDINLKVKSNLRIRAFYLFFIMGGIQIGVGLMGAPKYLFLEAQQDSWISILIAYAAILLVLWVMLAILGSYDNADIFGIQVDIFGKWIGKLFGTVYVLHFAVSLLIVMVTYIDVIQIFIFPEINIWLVAFLLLSLVVYCVAGGLRSVVGVVFLFFFLAHWILILLYKPISLIDYTHYQPVLQASMIDLLTGARSATFTLTGFEILFLIYPFVQNKKQAWRSSLLGVTWSAGMLLLHTLVVIGYFSAHQMETMEWTVLSVFNTIKLPFIARFDLIVVAEWMMMTLPTMILLMWGLTHGMKRLYHVPKRITLYVTAMIIFAISGFFFRHEQIITMTSILNNIDFWIVFVYPLILLPLVKLKKQWRKRQKGRKKT